MIVSYTPPGESSVDLRQIRDYGGGTIVQELQGMDARIRGSGSVKLQSAAASYLELGDVSGSGVRIDDGKLEFNSTSAQLSSGIGPPSGSAPNGSIDLRSDGGVGSTLYVREAGSWVAK